MAQMTVYDYAAQLAIENGLCFRVVSTVDVGFVDIDSRQGTVSVHPDSAHLTLEMNTTRGTLLPGAYDKR